MQEQYSKLVQNLVLYIWLLWNATQLKLSIQFTISFYFLELVAYINLFLENLLMYTFLSLFTQKPAFLFCVFELVPFINNKVSTCDFILLR